MMSYRLAPDRHAIAIGDQVMILDAQRDRYLLLKPPAALALEAFERRDFTHPGVARLHALGIIEPGPWRAATPSLPPPLSSVLDQSAHACSDLAFATVAAGVVRSLLDLKIRGLAATLRQVAQRSKEGARDDGRTFAIAQGFARHRLRLPLHDICLAESLALLRVLNAHGLDASFVIGVRLDPFGAHCWLQLGDSILNDSCDHASQFTPILVQ